MRRFRPLQFLLQTALLLLMSVSISFADSMEKEIALGKNVSAELEIRWETTADPVQMARLELTLAKLVPFTTRPLPYEVRMIRDKMVNAFCLPGGIIYFSTGMLDFLRTDAEIAAIMAHELVHADRNHVMKQAARSSRVSVAALALMIASRGAVGPMILTNLLQVAVTNAYSMDLEREADKEGFKMLVSAGFPPAAMVTTLEAMIYDQIKRPIVDLGVYATHPELSERLHYIVDMAEEMRVPLERKKALRLLRPAIRPEGGDLVLTVDGMEVCRSSAGEEGRIVLEKLFESIESSLQMETPPYDIQVLEIGGAKALRIGPVLAAREPLPEGTTPLSNLRESLVEALLAARDRHPSSGYNR